MGPLLLPAFLAVAGLLVLAGAHKLVTGARRDRVLGLAEAALGLACLAAPGPVTAVALAVTFGLFAVVAARRARAGASCGCFGDEHDEPAGPLHVGLDLVLAAVAVSAAAAPVPGLAWLWAQGAGATAVVALAAAASTWALFLCFTVLPRAWRAWGTPA